MVLRGGSARRRGRRRSGDRPKARLARPKRAICAPNSAALAGRCTRRLERQRTRVRGKRQTRDAIAGVRRAQRYQVSAVAASDRPNGISRPRTVSTRACWSALAATIAVKTPKTPAANRARSETAGPVSYTHLRAHETRHDLV